MKQIHFRFGTFGRWQKPVIQFSHSGQDWNKYFEIAELEYWTKTYEEWGYNVIFKPLNK
jgi:hypothetical protein